MICKAFLKGVQFDSVAMGYILAVPVMLLVIDSFVHFSRNICSKVSSFILVLMSIAFIICTVDIPYYNYNSARITSVIFNWTSNLKMVFEMVTEEKSYFEFAILLIVMIVVYVVLIKKLLKRFVINQNQQVVSLKGSIVYSLLSFILLFFALRGRIDSPIKISHSFFCYSSFYNQLGLNPVFSLVKSFAESKKLNVIEEADALKNVTDELHIQLSNGYTSPIARLQNSKELPNKLNVVLVIMESMSANKLGHFGNPKKLTPFLDSLIGQSYCFENFYSAGRHTYNGIFSSLYSFPAILAEHPMSSPNLKQYTGLPFMLKNAGYETVFFTTHDPSFDNIGTFLRTNSFNQIISQNDYDKTKIQSAFGVPDHVMFEYAVDTLDQLSKRNNPFLATLMTVSDHAPYIIPSNILFSPKHKELNDQIIEYADWALQDFFERCSQKPWFSHTLFVFVADHGAVVGDSPYNIPLSYHHIPFLIYCPDTNIIKPKYIDNFGTQIDIFPTIMNLLHLNFLNNTLGVNLLNEKRKFAFFSSDDKVGCIDDQYFYIYNMNGSEYLHKYRSGDLVNYLDKEPERAQRMKTYSFAMIKTAKYLMETNKTGADSSLNKKPSFSRMKE